MDESTSLWSRQKTHHIRPLTPHENNLIDNITSLQHNQFLLKKIATYIMIFQAQGQISGYLFNIHDFLKSYLNTLVFNFIVFKI